MQSFQNLLRVPDALVIYALVVVAMLRHPLQWALQGASFQMGSDYITLHYICTLLGKWLAWHDTIYSFHCFSDMLKDQTPEFSVCG